MDSLSFPLMKWIKWTFLLMIICLPKIKAQEQASYYLNHSDTLNKSIPAELVQVILKTLAHYPELDTVAIEFVINDKMHNSFMQAQPIPIGLIRKRKYRKYKIQLMSSLMIGDSIIPTHLLPEDALMGWFGHEIGHIVDYENMDNIEIMIFGLRYLFSKNYVIRTEKRVDLIAIAHGLGKENIAWKEYVLGQPLLPKAYLDKIKQIYMPPSKVEEILKGQE